MVNQYGGTEQVLWTLTETPRDKIKNMAQNPNYTPTKTTATSYAPNQQLPASVAGPIQQSISQSQAGISQLKGGGSSGGSQPLHNYISTNPADSKEGSRPGMRLQPEGVVPTKPTVAPTEPIQQLDPNAQAPQSMVDQTTALQGQVNNFATSKGLTLKPTATGGYSAVPDESALRKQAHEALTQSGVPASQQAGVGSAVTQSALGSFAPQSESPSILGPIQETDSMFDSLFLKFDEYFSPEVQKTSLVDEYSKISKSLGIDAINTELIDTKRIIDGTESDVRLEIEKSGGLATDSQVMALANSRNKQLIKNYNYLLDTKNASMQQLETMMQLSIQDRTFANAEWDRKMNFAFKVAEYQEKAVNNTRENFKWMIENGGGANILLDPRATQAAERSLGIPSGGLAGVITKQTEATNLATRKTQAEITKLEADAAKARAEMPGSPESVASAKAKAQLGVDKASNVLTKVTEAKGLIGKSTTGALGQALQYIGGTKARSLKGKITTIKANLAFDQLQAMREASKTGGALGSTSEREVDLLESSVSALDQAQDSASLESALNDVTTHYTNWLNYQGYDVAPDGTVVKITE